MKEFGEELARQEFPTKKRKAKEPKPGAPSKSQAKLHRKFLKQNKGVDFNPAPKPAKVRLDVATLEPVQQDWSRIKYGHETYTVEEVAILIRPAPDVQPHVLMTMHHVRGYVDVNGSVMLRPVTAPAEQGGALALPAPAEAKQSERRAPREHRSVVLGGSNGLNPAQEGSKRFFIVESLFAGGTAVEILKSADKMARKKGGYGKGEVAKVLPATTKKVTEFAEKMAQRVTRAGKRVKVVVKGKIVQLVPEEPDPDKGVIVLTPQE